MNITTKIFQVLISFIIGVSLLYGAPVLAYAEEIEEKESFKSGIIGNIVEQLDILEAQIQEQQIEQAYQNKINSVRDTALQYLGIPYMWGGTSPRGFDCSGLVQYVYQQCGVSLPRTTYSQINCGEEVSLDSLAIGDIVFWGNYHVGIYIGNNQYIHAPRKGTTVRIQSMSSYCPTSARRIIFK